MEVSSISQILGCAPSTVKKLNIIRIFDKLVDETIPVGERRDLLYSKVKSERAADAIWVTLMDKELGINPSDYDEIEDLDGEWHFGT